MADALALAAKGPPPSGRRRHAERDLRKLGLPVEYVNPNAV
jgi:hypothetical protein